MTAAASRPAVLDPAAWRALVRWLLDIHHVETSSQTLDAAIRRLDPDAMEPAVDQLIRVLQQVGLDGIAVDRPFDEVLRDAAPSHPWLTFGAREDRRSPVAVLAARGSRVTVVDPMRSPRPRTVGARELAQQLGLPDTNAHVRWMLPESVAPLAAMRSRGDAPMAPIARLKAMLQGERQTLWVAVVYSVVIGLLSLVVPIAVQSLVNTIAFGSATQPLVVLTLLVAVGLGFSAAINALRAGVVEIIQRSLFARTAVDVTHRLLRVRAEAFDRYHGPELVNRFFDVVTVQKSAALLLIDGLSIVMQTMIGMVLLALYHPWLLAFDVLIVAAMLFIVFVLGRGAIATSISESKAKYALEAWLEQMASHLVTFKSRGGAEYATRRSHALLEEYLAYRSKHFRILLRQIIGSFALQAVASSLLLGIGGWLVIERQLTLGQLVASELIVALMVSAFTKFGKQLEVFYDLVAAIDKLGALVDLPLERVGGEAILEASGPASLALAGVQVGYTDSDTPALDIARLEVAAGERLGVTGPTGSGKSTLADVLFGLRAASRGTMRLDGFDTRDIPLADLRQCVALVRQIEVFPGSVIDNVRLGREDLSLADVTDALRRAGLHDELLQLPDGLATTLHPSGRPLSSRQASRLMIARAIAGQPRLLVLDGVLDQIDNAEDRDRLMPLLFGRGCAMDAGLHHRRPQSAGPVLARAVAARRSAAGRAGHARDGAGMKPAPSSTEWRTEGRVALQALHAPRASRVLARLLLILMAVGVLVLVVTPWQQNIAGTGRVIAYNPEDRPQDVQAPIDGRIVRWHVVEGTTVRKGDPLVDLTDNDPSIMQRLAEERDALVRTITETERRLRSIEDRVAGLRSTQSTGVSAADMRVRMAAERVAAADQALSAARAAKVTADLNLERQTALLSKGLTSTRAVELAQLEAAQRVADVDRAVASLNAARHEQGSLDQERLRTDADGDTRIDEAWAAHASAASDLAKARADLTRLDGRVARQSTQKVRRRSTAPSGASSRARTASS